MPILLQTAFAQKTAHEILQERDALGQPSDPIHMKDNKQYINPAEMSTNLEYKGAILIVTQTISKLEYKVGENITVHCALVNIGSNAITINHLVPLLQSSVTYENGSAYFPINYPYVLIGGDATIEPGNPITDPDCRPSPGDYPASIVKISTPGTYNVTSFAYFTIHDNLAPISFEPLWSKPIQITILPEKVPEFPFAIPILLISITSLIVFYRMKFSK